MKLVFIFNSKQDNIGCYLDATAHGDFRYTTVFVYDPVQFQELFNQSSTCMSVVSELMKLFVPVPGYPYVVDILDLLNLTIVHYDALTTLQRSGKITGVSPEGYALPKLEAGYRNAIRLMDRFIVHLQHTSPGISNNPGAIGDWNYGEYPLDYGTLINPANLWWLLRPEIQPEEFESSYDLQHISANLGRLVRNKRTYTVHDLVSTNVAGMFAIDDSDDRKRAGPFWVAIE